MNPSVKICGLTRRADAAVAAEGGAGYLGVILVPGTPRFVDPKKAREVVTGLGVPGVAVVADETPEKVGTMAEAMGASVIQLHGGEAPEEVVRLRELGVWKLWKALRVRGPGDVEEAVSSYGHLVDGLLLDGWHPNQKGGTGTAFPWEVAEGLRGRLPQGTLFIAAGGLHPGNVAEAVTRLGPDVVDVSSGVEASPGIKDPRRVADFFRQVREAGQQEDV